MTPETPGETRTLIDELLEEQRQLTAVQQFARVHSNSGVPDQALLYRALIPLEQPRPGEQFAFAVDLDKCSGCKACVSACHSLNGLDEDETWRSTGLLHGGTSAQPYQQVVTSACHHCIDPACLNGCPVLAYEKDAVTGIVRHLDDQCIGCQYCVLKCPYDVPKYSARRGIVRKCDMCHGRLAAGEAPACVQACPGEAITIRLISSWEAAQSCASTDQRLVPGAFPSRYTLPTTTYTSRRPIPVNAAPADAAALRLEPAHWPLIWMLVLTQAAAGGYLILAALALLDPRTFVATRTVGALFNGGLLLAGLGISVLHLGRPAAAWRAFLGWRRSWMSREIIGFGCFAASASTLATAVLFKPFQASLAGLTGATAALGLLATFCSAMIYVDTHRPFWRASSTFIRFFGTMLLLGAAGTATILAWNISGGGLGLGFAARAAAWTAILVRAALFLWETWALLQSVTDPRSVNHRSGLILWRRLKPVLVSRAALFTLSTLFGLLALSDKSPGFAWLATISVAATFGSQLIERYCFFVAVAAPRMPGGLP
jgi:Fe-S-cluster-containing dehydrogenase component/DMSO reductase anchor subunit